MGVGARALAMGGGYAALATDATAAYWNPAGLGQLKRSDASFMHSTLFGLDSYDYLAVARPFGDSVWSASLLRVGVGDIILTTVKDSTSPVSSVNRPLKSGTASIASNAVGIGWGKQILETGGNAPRGVVYAGASGKLLFISSGVPTGTNGLGVGGDVGFLGVWRAGDGTRFRAAVNGQDFFRTNIYWNTVPRQGAASHKDTILQNAKIAAAVSQSAPGGSVVTISAETDSRQEFEMHYGAEWALGEALALRAGLQERKSSAETLRDVTAGAGLQLGFVGGESFRVDYAFTGGDLGGSHRVSLGVRF